MTNYIAHPITREVIPPKLVPEELAALAPAIAGMCTGARLVRHVGTNFFHWEARWGGTTSPWQICSPLIERRPVTKVNVCPRCFTRHGPFENCPAQK